MTARVKRSQIERSTATRQALITAAVDCICEMGFVATTLALVAKRAGVTRGAVQYHFGSRDDVLEAVMEVVREMNFDVDLKALHGRTVEQRVRALVTQYRKAFTSKSFIAALNIWLGAQGDPKLLARLQLVIAKMQRPLRQIWSDVFHDLGLPSARLQSARHIVMSAVRGYTIQEMLGIAAPWPADSKVLIAMTTRYLLEASSGQHHQDVEPMPAEAM